MRGFSIANRTNSRKNDFTKKYKKKQPQKMQTNLEWEPHRAAHFSSVVRLKHHTNMKMPRCYGWTHVIGAQPSTISTGLGQLPQKINSILAEPIKTYNTRRVSNTVETKTHRAAIFCSSVGLKHHIVVHRQLSVGAHVNLRAGLGRLNANNTIVCCQRVTHVSGPHRGGHIQIECCLRHTCPVLDTPERVSDSRARVGHTRESVTHTRPVHHEVGHVREWTWQVNSYMNLLSGFNTRDGLSRESFCTRML